MNFKRLGNILTIVGLFGAVFSLSSDALGFGNNGIQAAQLLGIEFGVILAVCGYCFSNIQRQENIRLKEVTKTTADWLLNLPTIVWVIVGFLIAYVFMFIFPVFLNSSHRMQYFNRYIPDHYPIGLDLNTIVGSITAWLSNNQGPYQNPDIFYPPLHHVLLAPFLLLEYPQNYYLLTAFTLISLFFLSFLIPLLSSIKRDYSITIFFFVTSLFSYGFQFELERGQFNVITFTICLLAVYLFHFHESFRPLAYLLFSVSIHLRIYPAIFIVLFIKDWTTWKQNIKRLLGLSLLNLALLFVLGYSTFVQFIHAVSSKVGTSWTWIGNHSITSFVFNLTNSGFGLFNQDTLIWLRAHANLVTVALLACFLICFMAVLIKDLVQRKRGLNPDLLLICTIGGMMIPSVSHDYKLALLAGPMAIALSNRMTIHANWRKLLSALLTTLASLAFSVSLFPFKYKPEYLQNSFPSLIIILITISLLSFIVSPKYLGVGMTEGIQA